MARVVGMKPVHVKDEIVANRTRVQIDQDTTGRRGFLGEHVSEGLDGCRGDGRTWTRSEAREHRQIG